MSEARLELVVDELVVRGLSPGQAREAAAALEARLAALAAQSRVAVRGREEAFRRLPEVTAPEGRPDALGAAVAEAVWGALAPAPGGRQ